MESVEHAPGVDAGSASSRPRLDAGLRIEPLVRLARPRQWAKSAFVVVGPLYALADRESVEPWALAGAVLAFGFASSACYVINDVRDREEDRQHPRKRHRPVASGEVSVNAALTWAGVLGAAAAASVLLALAQSVAAAAWLAAIVLLYFANTTIYSLGVKRIVILDVISLAVGFVLRVLGGCAAAGVEPSTWLLNCTFFVSMFLAFGKRLGERRTMGQDVSAVRGVQSVYTDELLRMVVVVTAVGALITYAGYVQAKEAVYLLMVGDTSWGFNLLWLTMLPATYGMLRCIVLLEAGRYDDPTELAARDRGFQVAVGLFAGVMAVLFIASRLSGGAA